MKHWFTFTNKADDPSVVDIHIIDIIGGWIDEWWSPGGGPGIVTAKTFLDQLSKLTEPVKTIRLFINSPGGDVFAGIAMANGLRDQMLTKGRAVHVFVEGLAASAATIPMMAGRTITIADNALVMIHNPWSVGIGNAAEIRKVADELDTIRDAIVATYKWQSSLSVEEIAALMDAETWLDADEAIAAGFATDKAEGLKAAALLDPRGLAKMQIPEKFKAQVEALVAKADPAPTAPPPAAALDVLRVCREGECLDLSESLIAKSATLPQVEDAVRQARETRAAATARATAITDICAHVKLLNLAGGYIASAMDTAAVKAHLALIVPLRDSASIDGSLPASGHQAQSGGPSLNSVDIYSKRNAKKE
jgi:ATP-dependent protease ClpP protease subunit